MVCSSTTLMAWQIAKKSQSFGYCCYITSNWPDFLCTNRHQLFSPWYNFFAKLIIYIFFCLVQKSVTVCFQSILLVSKRLLIILLSHSKFFIGHCTHPLFLGTFSFAARSRIYHFFCQMDFKRLPTSYDYNFLYFLLLLHQHSLEKKDVRNPAECLNIG